MNYETRAILRAAGVKPRWIAAVSSVAFATACLLAPSWTSDRLKSVSEGVAHQAQQRTEWILDLLIPALPPVTKPTASPSAATPAEARPSPAPKSRTR
jgi:hypothetical protein